MNFAGGAGGKPDTHAGASCQPERLGAVMAQAGQKHTAEFFPAPPVDTDGHRLLTVGGRLWSPPLNAWLKKNGF